VSIERSIASIREDRRADYLWDTKVAADAVNLHVNKFSAWWYANRAKLIELAIADPGNTAAELLAVIATAESQRQRRKRNPESNLHP
jgi:hypothetical protein